MHIFPYHETWSEFGFIDFMDEFENGRDRWEKWLLGGGAVFSICIVCLKLVLAVKKHGHREVIFHIFYVVKEACEHP